MGYNIKAHWINHVASSCAIENPLGLAAHQVRAVYTAADAIYSLLKPKHVLLQAKFLASQFIDPSLSKEHHKASACLLSLEAL